ncbi:MAG TPA: tryptophan synthase subunit alpha [Gemmatimonadales bacterium]
MTGPARYRAMFDGLALRGEGAFVPFLVLGDPDPETSLGLIRALVRGGADALELGLPFSDPIADGPVIQAAATRALAAGVRIADGWRILTSARAEFPAIPIGLLVYANLVMHDGPEAFFRAAAAAGVDSVLVADAPILESGPLAAAARSHGIAPVCIAPPNADARRLAAIAKASEGYVYVTSRPGVTGADDTLRSESADLIRRLGRLGAAPAMLGFGIATPEHVRGALALGAAGAISGSAVVRHVEQHLPGPGLFEAVEQFTRRMKAATR